MRRISVALNGIEAFDICSGSLRATEGFLFAFNALVGMSRSLLIYYNSLRTRQLRRLYSEFVETGDIVVDDGARVGSKTHAALVASAPQP